MRAFAVPAMLAIAVWLVAAAAHGQAAPAEDPAGQEDASDVPPNFLVTNAKSEIGRHTKRGLRDFDALALAAKATYRPGPVYSRGPDDPVLYRGPFVLRRTPIVAEHKFPWEYGISIRVIKKLRYYPFLGWDVYVDHGDRLRLVATNFIFNSAPVPARSDFLEVPEGAGLGYVENPLDGGATEKFLILRLADNTLKVTRLDDDGSCVYSVYCISGRVWARYAQTFHPTEEPVEITILPQDLANAAERRHLERLMRGFENHRFMGYWTLPEKEHLRDWGGIRMPRDLRCVDADGEGETMARPIDVGVFDVIFEEALTYTGEGYSTLRNPVYRFPLFFPMEPGDVQLLGSRRDSPE